MKNIPQIKGFSMLEVLITLIIVAVGLLGLAALQSRAQQAEFESYQRAQALLLLEDMVNRINTNRAAVDCYVTSAGTTGAAYLGEGITAINNCTAAGTTATRALADADITAWDNMLKGTGETLGGSNTGSMIGGRGCVSYDAGTDTYTIAVAWQGSIDTIVPTNTCGQNLYTAESKRRVVTQTVRFADLG